MNAGFAFLRPARIYRSVAPKPSQTLTAAVRRYCRLVGLVFFVNIGWVAYAAAVELVVPPIGPFWSDHCNAVAGHYSTPQAVCDARRALITWQSPLTYVPGGLPSFDGACKDDRDRTLGYAYFASECPAGFVPRNQTGLLCTAHNGIGTFYGPNLECVRDVPLWYLSFPVVIPEVDKSDLSCYIGDPVNPVSGEVIHSETIDAVNNAGSVPIAFTVRSFSGTAGNLGIGWTHSYSRSVVTTSRPGVSYGATGYAFSGKYADAQTACSTGWSQVKPTIAAAWASASYGLYLADGRCEIHYSDNGTDRVWGVLTMYVDTTPGLPFRVGQSQIKILKFSRPDGKVVTFQQSNGVWTNESGIKETVTELTDVNGVVTGYRYTTATNEIETYDTNGELTNGVGKLLGIVDSSGNTTTLSYNSSGRLQSVTGASGVSKTFGYDPTGRINAITDNAGRVWTIRYDAGGNLEYIDNPDLTTRRFHYEDSHFPSHLTGITDERGIRNLTNAFDAAGRAIANFHANNVDRVDITYDDINNTRNVTNSRGIVSTYTIDPYSETNVVTGIAGPGCSTCGASNTVYDYDNNHNLISKTDNGLTTEYGSYDANGNAGFMIEAKGTTQERRIEYTYDSRFFSKAATITEPSVYGAANKITTHTYDTNGNLTQTTISGYTPAGLAVSRTTSLAYNGPLNQLTQIDGPRTNATDITTFDYYPNDAAEGNHRARLKQVTSGGLILRDAIQYTATGRVLSETRPNGLTLSHTYYPGNDRLQTLTETAGGVANTTRWTYLATGEVQTITTAHGSADATTLTFSYDDARRLTRITDGLGNSIQYTLDTEGNQTAENIYDATNGLRKAISRTFDVYNRFDVTTQANETLNSDFAPNGTLAKQTDGNGRVTAYGYDNLKRLINVTQDLGGTATSTQNALTQYGYDAQDHLTRVTDPTNGTTNYLYDDLGNLIVQTSPDTGATTFSHDNAGNVTATSRNRWTPKASCSTTATTPSTAC
ncbi:MAG: hypothetical protein FD165_1701 [Gammaproteobacteria bacterium]|nr:MAG: hypothetical protein FD165_1701 [Gammaproteobacteria bacterium]